MRYESSLATRASIAWLIVLCLGRTSIDLAIASTIESWNVNAVGEAVVKGAALQSEVTNRQPSTLTVKRDVAQTATTRAAP